MAMLDVLCGKSRTCEGLSRRSFMQIGALAGFGMSLPTFLKARSAQAATTSKDVNCILIWTHGGTSHHDTLDPKPNAPASVRGEFGAINTAIPGVQFSEICPNMAAAANRFAVLRGWNPKNGSHGMAEAWMMSGRQYSPAVTYPCYGSVISHAKGFRTALPPFVQLGDFMDHRFNGGSAGILGLENNPFLVMADPSAARLNVRDITPPAGISAKRVSFRRRMLGAIDRLERHATVQPAAYHALDEHYKTALNMITAPETKRAFEIETETTALRDRYGRTRFGQSCLLARRLIEAGVRFVTITDTGWDTHQNNFTALKSRLVPPIDQGLPQLLADLENRGMLSTTLVVWVTDFGRTPNVNSASGRDHWASSGFAVMAGAGVPGGAILGATDDEGTKVVRDEYFTEDIAATVYAKLGLPADLTVNSPDGRPIRLVEGRLIKEWV
jgi:uncharacterized protein (DUF1501 family)